MRRRIDDAELHRRIRAAIEHGTSRTEFGFRLTAERIAMGRERLERAWEEAGGPVQVRIPLYVNGTEPRAARPRTNRGPQAWSA